MEPIVKTATSFLIDNAEMYKEIEKLKKIMIKRLIKRSIRPEFLITNKKGKNSYFVFLTKFELFRFMVIHKRKTKRGVNYIRVKNVRLSPLAESNANFNKRKEVNSPLIAKIKFPYSWENIAEN